MSAAVAALMAAESVAPVTSPDGLRSVKLKGTGTYVPGVTLTTTVPVFGEAVIVPSELVTELTPPDGTYGTADTTVIKAEPLRSVPSTVSALPAVFGTMMVNCADVPVTVMLAFPSAVMSAD